MVDLSFLIKPITFLFDWKFSNYVIIKKYIILVIGMGTIQADSRARFSHSLKFTPLIKSHR